MHIVFAERRSGAGLEAAVALLYLFRWCIQDGEVELAWRQQWPCSTFWWCIQVVLLRLCTAPTLAGHTVRVCRLRGLPEDIRCGFAPLPPLPLKCNVVLFGAVL
nr:uncharacterized protein LOC127345876 [Lolium perenne]